VELDANFFDLGGDSLCAIQIVNKLSEELGITFDSHALVRMPTVAMLCRWIEAQRAHRLPTLAAAPLQSNLIELHGGRSDHPLFLVHPVGGHVYCYMDLAQQLHLPQAIYGLSSANLDPRSAATPRSIEEISRGYLDQIKAVQPTGPYCLGGYSFGGLIVFEMARQLAREGQRVAPPILIDTAVPTPFWAAAEELDARLIAWFAVELGIFTESAALEESAVLEKLGPEQRLAYLLAHGKHSLTTLPVVDAEQLQRLWRVFVGNVRAFSNYAPQTYQGPVLLLRADDLRFTLSTETAVAPRPGVTDIDTTLGWTQYVKGGIEVHTVPGNHYTLMKRPGINVIADRLRQHLS
jgi:thioesterase domain-containing protein